MFVVAGLSNHERKVCIDRSGFGERADGCISLLLKFHNEDAVVHQVAVPVNCSTQGRVNIVQ